MRCMVEIVYIPATGDPVVKTIAWKPGITVKDALDQSLLLETFPELGDLSIGIFSQPVTYQTTLNPEDRVELYRPLLLDPKEKRRERARKSKQIFN